MINPQQQAQQTQQTQQTQQQPQQQQQYQQQQYQQQPQQQQYQQQQSTQNTQNTQTLQKYQEEQQLLQQQQKQFNDYNDFLKWKSQNTLNTQENNQQQNNKTSFEVMRENAENLKNNAKLEEQMRHDVEFDLNFDDLIEKNKNAFEFDAKKIREAAKGLEGKELIHTLKCTALKDYFSNKLHLDYLTANEALYINESVINKHDNNIDSAKAWHILENALHINERIKQNTNFRDNGENEQNTSTPNIDAYIKRISDNAQGIKETTSKK